VVVTITCPDRPGIVERVTEVIVAHDANWEESRLARLGGDFAGIIRIAVPGGRAEALAEALRGLSNEQMAVVVRLQPAADAPPPEGLYDLQLTGADHEGIVHTVASFLAHQGINLEEMQTEVLPAPMSASPLFHMEAKIRVPSGVALDDLRARLRHIGEQLGVDLDLKPAG
jgi:glycine cleavage system regulatory protein